MSKAIILSAGQGSRLLPLTAKRPKCLLPINGRTLLEWQIDTLLKAGFEDIVVVVGFCAEQVEKLVAQNYPKQVRTLYNPFYQVADNMGTCWLARGEMDRDFVLINGDTLFEQEVVETLLNGAQHPITLATDHKEEAYDDDDMKVTLDGIQLLNVGKQIPAEHIHGESIGMLRFQGEGPALFREHLDREMRREASVSRWYLSTIAQLAQTGVVGIQSIKGLTWGEVDCQADLRSVEQLTANWLDIEFDEVAYAS